MRIARFEWDASNEAHIARHGVEPSEAEEDLRRRPVHRRGRHGLRLAWGQTAAGRHLLVVFLTRPGGAVRVVTARDMSALEKRRYRRAGRRMR